jgi:hypothetical protein
LVALSVAVASCVSTIAQAQPGGPRLAEARSLLRHPCSKYIGAGATIPGYAAIPRFVPVVVPGHYVLTQQRHGARVAFLFTMTDDNLDSCVITDVVAMPPPAKAEALLVCGMSEEAPISKIGVALRQNGAKIPTAYWEVTGDKLVLEPGATPTCQFPEYGE